MKKVLLFARDPGGANVIMAMEEKLNETYQVLLWGKDVAFQKFQTAGLPVQDIGKKIKEINLETVITFVKQLNPDIMLTGTSADDMTEKYMWKAGEKLGIPSFAILDQWTNYGLRFSKYGVNEIAKYEQERQHEYLPDRILVMDEFAKEKMQEDGVSQDRILVTGQPYLEWFRQKVNEIDKKSIQEYHFSHTQGKGKLIVFASEPITKTYGENSEYWGYTEVTIFEHFHDILKDITEKGRFNVSVVVRPHPKEDIEIWKERLKNTQYITYFLDNQTEYKLAIASADLIVGMTSMFLLESALCGKEIVSLQIGLDRENSFILEKKGLVKSVLSKEEAQKHMQSYFQGRLPKVKWDVPENAIFNIERVMEEWV